MTLLLRWLGGALGPYVAIGVGLLLLSLAGTVLVQRVTAAELRTQIATLEADKRGLAGAVELQNDAVARMQKDCDDAAAVADLAAAKVLHTAPMPPPAGSGPEELNRWFAKRLPARSS